MIEQESCTGTQPQPAVEMIAIPEQSFQQTRIFEGDLLEGSTHDCSKQPAACCVEIKIWKLSLQHKTTKTNTTFSICWFSGKVLGSQFDFVSTKQSGHESSQAASIFCWPVPCGSREFIPLKLKSRGCRLRGPKRKHQTTLTSSTQRRLRVSLAGTFRVLD